MSGSIQAMVATLAAAMAIAGAAPTQSSLPPLKPLSASEIAIRFADVSIDTVVADRLEIFHTGGVYELQGRSVRWGAFTVADGKICVRIPPQHPTCRLASSDGAGGIYLSESADSAPPRRIKLRNLK